MVVADVTDLIKDEALLLRWRAAIAEPDGLKVLVVRLYVHGLPHRLIGYIHYETTPPTASGSGLHYC